MTYLRNPRCVYMWESDGDYNGKYKAQDGTLCDSAKEADARDRIEWNSERGCWELPDPPKKKPYTPPKLTVYGNIRNMTETSNRGSKSDHARRRAPHKTA